MSDKQDWIDWGGGECPVADSEKVNVWMRDEDALDAKHIEVQAGFWSWFHSGDEDDIIKYRIVGEVK